jgi:hypothetical protein
VATARARFAELDGGRAAAASREQGVLFESAREAAAPAPYGAGLRLAPCAGWWPGEAEAGLSATLVAGALHPCPVEGTTEGEALEALRRFEGVRAAVHARDGDSLFTPTARAARASEAAAPAAPLPGESRDVPASLTSATPPASRGPDACT